ncbi:MULTISPECIES: SDR family NAD(P)-dependent oxidoreductase [Mycobacteriaceae]|uniref:Short-chain membrane-associated dehydrogenase n=9 Tax=Mycobacteriaceae TaxID=1762 RepID=B2HG11_MYCMM|nr:MULTISPECIES: SDR family NAD(P)-dependent oxidoreductase [Mycobacteriaceae]OFB36437.1 short-chain dehydrogenase [Mycolicibacterium sp. (ex Dasyatis americana)]UVO14906.1 SDR family NAD(P)-dependent oxidoreductase [Mycobacterium sp. SVM_VP21]ACC41575.1 short-chain membrane-associated dehydrogenase [Mycobacterium marinum M]AYE98917.1 KR domain-containing protein [Mycobacterium paragordonae]KUI40220.1 short-chain dehydrogenase [Mycobacterium sp. GA-2829]
MRFLPFGSSPGRTHRAHAVVTGAGSGIGRAFAVELARRGGRVVCADKDPITAKESAELVRQAGGEGFDVVCDVTDLEQVRNLADASEDWFGKAASLVINNAGIGAGGNRIGATSVEDWNAAISVNLWGVIYGCETFVPRLRSNGRGGVINVASAASFGSAPRMGAYNVSKAGVLALSETLAAELSGTNVNVTVLCPTFVKTNIAKNPQIEESAAKLATNLMRWTGISPDQVARTTLNAHDRGQIYVVPQLDAKILWQLKRALPGQFTRALGLVERVASWNDPAEQREQ